MIIDINGVELTAPDLDKGYLLPDTITIHHDAVPGTPEQGHYETVAEYPSGGKDVAWVVDVPGVEPSHAWDDVIPVERYIEYTSEELSDRAAKALQPTEAERWQAQLAYTAMMTDTLLEGVV